jgi:hypothetical protein
LAGSRPLPDPFCYGVRTDDAPFEHRDLRVAVEVEFTDVDAYDALIVLFVLEREVEHPDQASIDEVD